MRVLGVTLVVALLACGALAGIARRDVQEDQDFEFPGEEEAAIKGADTKDDTDDTKLAVPARDARVLNFSPLNQVTEYMRNLIPRAETIRPVTRQVFGAVQGREECFQMMLCRAGRMLVGFRQTPQFFSMVEKYGPEVVQNAFHVMKRAAVEGDDCSAFVCNA